MVLVDTSVWVEHLRRGNTVLKEMLQNEQVLCHPYIVGELACGNLRNRKEILNLLTALPLSEVAEHDEILHLIDARRLHGRGIGWVDVHLLASALITGCELWTLDKPLRDIARWLKVLA